MVLNGRDDQRSEVCVKPEPAKKQDPPKQEQLNKWQEYERRKKGIPSDLKPFDYVAECTRIAKELGI